MRILFYIITAFWTIGALLALYNLQTIAATIGLIYLAGVTFCVAVLAIIETIKSLKVT